jgi:hypothetical protein
MFDVFESLSRARRVKTVNLEADFARAAYKRPSATLDGNYQLGSLTTGSPAGHLNLVSRLKGEWHGAASPLFLFARALRRRLLIVAWRLNVQSGLQDPENNTLGILQPT